MTSGARVWAEEGCPIEKTEPAMVMVDRKRLAAMEAEIDGLRGRMVELLEILRNWEPDHASAEERHTILQAMYQTGDSGRPNGDAAQHDGSGLRQGARMTPNAKLKGRSTEGA